MNGILELGKGKDISKGGKCFSYTEFVIVRDTCKHGCVVVYFCGVPMGILVHLFHEYTK